MWDKYKAVINGLAQTLFHGDEITWMRLVQGIDYNGEADGYQYEPIQLKCLIGYNDFRTWPIDRASESGTIDTQSMYVILNKKYLLDNGYLNDHGHLAYKPNKDYFVKEGIEYEDSGDTSVAQAGNEPILFYIILKRRESKTGEPLY
jgi:hypothetical protein